MLDIQIISQIVGLFIGIGAIIVAFAFAYSQIKLGGNKAKDDLIGTLQTTVSAKDETIRRLESEKTTLINSHQEQINTIQKELSELKGAFGEQSKKLDEYKTLLEGRDPYVLEILKKIDSGIATLNAHQITNEKATKIVAEKAQIVADRLEQKGGGK